MGVSTNYEKKCSQKQPPGLLALYQKGVLKNFEKFKQRHLCQGLFFDKVAGLRPLLVPFIF